MNILALLRSPQFSPNSVEKDRAIMMAVADILRRVGHVVEVVQEEAHPQAAPDVVLTMGRLPATLKWLEGLSSWIVNTPQSVRLCSDRCRLTTVMRRLQMPLPPDRGNKGYWLKRGDASAQTAADVVYSATETELQAHIRTFEERGISQYVVQSHVEGDLVKFYGVRGTAFFRYFYPTDDGDMKFPAVERSGKSRHYSFSVDRLHHDAERLAQAIALDVYGGDCIVRSDGTYCLIDYNDWPSFSRCRDEAAEAIAGLLIERKIDGKEF